nr:hypothetical protein [Kofleriaceae bacterium]
MRPVCLAFAVAACSGGAQQISISSPPAKESTGTFSGPLCTGPGTCKCRDLNAPGDGGAGVPEAGSPLKRYEFRLGPSSQELWATVHGAVMYKSPERAEDCWYLDLPSGEQDVELRASDPAGVSAAWTIRELGTQTKSWYDTLEFNCGSPGVCGFDDLERIKSELSGSVKNRVRDRCGSTKIKGITWDSGKSPDQLHPSDLAVHVHLEIYKRAPDRPHGDPDCGKRGAGSDAPSDAGGSDAP